MAFLRKNRDGHIIKVEGNPLHPVNGGSLCARGQASLHGLYNPDRFPGPVKRDASGKFEPIPRDRAEEILLRAAGEILKSGKPERIVFMTGIETGTLKGLIDRWVSEMGSPEGHIIFEPFAYESLKTANRTVFGKSAIPLYEIDRADFIVSFNAGFLETWLSNVEYARRFASYRAFRDGRKNPFVYVGPRLSMTAANSDLWVSVPPGREYLIAVGMLRVILDEHLAPALTGDQGNVLAQAVERWPIEKVAVSTGVDARTIRSLAQQFARAKAPLALAEGLPTSAANATETAIAANLLCTVVAGTRNTMDFSRASSYGLTAEAGAVKDLAERMKRGEVDLLLLRDVNPVFSLPFSEDFLKGMERVPLVVSFSSATDETTALAHLVLPTDTPLESWEIMRRGTM